MAIALNDNIYIAAGKNVEPKSVRSDQTPYASVTEANNTIPLAERYRGLAVVINDGSGDKKYWYKDGVANGNLVPFAAGSSFTFENALTESLGVVKVGGPLTENTSIGLGAYSFGISGSDSSFFISDSSAQFLRNNGGGLRIEQSLTLYPDGVTPVTANKTTLEGGSGDGMLGLWNGKMIYGKGLGNRMLFDMTLLGPMRTQTFQDADGVIQLQGYLGTKELTNAALSPTLTENGKLLSWDNTAGKYDLKSFSSFFTGTSSQFTKGDGSLDSNNYVQDTGGYTTGINNMTMYNSSGKIERTTNLTYQPTEQLIIQSNRISDIGYFASNSHISGQCSITSSSNYSSAGIRSFGSSFGFGLSGYNIFHSTKKMALMSNSTVSNGGIDDIEVFVGGYDQSQIVMKFRQSEVVAEFTKAIKLGDSTTTEAGALRYNTSTTSHQSYNGVSWQYGGGIGLKQLSATALNPGLSQDKYVYQYDHTSGNVDIVSLESATNNSSNVVINPASITSAHNGKTLLFKTSPAAIQISAIASIPVGFRCKIFVRNQSFQLTCADLVTTFDGAASITSNSGYMSFELFNLDGVEFNTL